MWGKTWSKKIDSNTQKHKQLPSSPALLHMQSVSSSTTRFNYIPIRQINLCLFSPPLQYFSKTITFVNDFLKLLQPECSSGLRCFFNFYSSGIHWPHICFRDHLLYMKHSNYHSWYVWNIIIIYSQLHCSYNMQRQLLNSCIIELKT